MTSCGTSNRQLLRTYTTARRRAQVRQQATPSRESTAAFLTSLTMSPGADSP